MITVCKWHDSWCVATSKAQLLLQTVYNPLDCTDTNIKISVADFNSNLVMIALPRKGYQWPELILSTDSKIHTRGIRGYTWRKRTLYSTMTWRVHMSLMPFLSLSHMLNTISTSPTRGSSHLYPLQLKYYIKATHMPLHPPPLTATSSTACSRQPLAPPN